MNDEALKLIFCSFLLISVNLACSASNILSKGSSLSVEREDDILVSPNKAFTCGFYNHNGGNAFWLGIWFTNSTTVVWTANRDKPVNGRGSKLTLRRDGIMVLRDVDGTIAWQTNTTATVDVRRAELLNSGNLVLIKGASRDKTNTWQSFDYPTDTLLPGQLFTKSNKLVSSLKKGSAFSGYFNFYFDNDNVLRLMYDGPEISSQYWPNPDFDLFGNGRTNYNSTRIAVLDESGRFVSSDRFEFNASDRGLGIKRRLTMDSDGNLRLYSLHTTADGPSTWSISWEALSDLCKVHGLCGRNGICIYTPSPTCSCPSGYEMNDPSDWSQGCKAKFDFNLTCSKNTSSSSSSSTTSNSNNNDELVKFVEILHSDYYGFDLGYFPNTSFTSCKNACVTDCSCLAFGYRFNGERLCFTKTALFSGYQSVEFPANIYLKLPSSLPNYNNYTTLRILNATQPACVPGQNTLLLGSATMYDTIAKRVKWVYLYAFAVVIGAIEVVFFIIGWCILFRRRGPDPAEDGYRALLSQFRKFTYAELKTATRNFNNEIGRGGSGFVYKGELGDGRAVAVKRLSEGYGFGEEVFWSEVSTIGKINHMNLARMWGFCAEGTNRLLVYEFVENMSLDKHLFGRRHRDDNTLKWKDRFKIAVGTAKGLAYLHHECLEWVIHCDVKPENILLASDFEAKIADFGLAKLFNRGGDVRSNFSRIRGTKGYMAPEWALNLPITAKVDVFSYGVTVLEVVRGVRVSDWEVVNKEGGGDIDEEEEEEEESVLTRFVKMVKKKRTMVSDEKWLDEVVDSRLRGEYSKTQVRALVDIGVSCVEEDRTKRPTMDSIVHVLMQSHDHDHDHDDFYSIDS